MWARRHRDDELRVPIGVTATGEPLIFDLKDEAEGGMGPHGLMIGMTGSGKSQTLMSILLSLLTTHSADRLIVIYADFKGEAGADIFRHFPQVVAVISNMAEKKSLADRFADTLRGEVARREMMLREAGRKVQGSAFNSVTEYENAIAAGHDLPSIPTLFVVADEFTLMLADHPEYAELFDYVARKGRSFRIHILFASQTLDVGKIKDIDKNTSYRIGLKVASPSVSRSIIGVEDAYHIESGKEHKGVGFLVPAPGAAPIRFRSTYVDGIYDPPQAPKTLVVHSVPEPKLFTAGRVEPDQTTVIAKNGHDEPVAPSRKLIATIGDQLARFGPRAPELWLPPLDEVIPLSAALARAAVPRGEWRWPLGEIDRPFQMRRDPLVFDARSSAGNLLIHGGAKSGKSTALQTFILSAASLHSPREVSFYCLDYGGGQLRALEDLAHVGSVASSLEPERIRRTFGELEQLLRSRQEREVFRDKQGPDDGLGQVFLIIDNLYAFSRDNTDQFNTRNPLLSKVTELVNVGLAYGIHVVATTPSWLEVPLAMRDGLGMRLELKLHDARDSNVRMVGALHRPAEGVPADQPGRGLTMAAEHFLFAAPQLDQIAAINDRHAGITAPPVRLLPTNLEPAALEPVYGGSDRIVIGQREEDLAAVQLDFAQNPLLMVLGDTRTGKTTLVAAHHPHHPGQLDAGPCRVHRAGSTAASGRRAAVPRQRVHRQHRPGDPGDARAVGAHRKAPAAGRSHRLAADRLVIRGPHPLPDHRRRRPDTGHSGNDGTLCGTAALDSADRITVAGRRSGTAGHRHGARNRRRARADDQPVAAPVQRPASDHADAVGQPDRWRQDSRSAIRPAAARSRNSADRQRYPDVRAVGQSACRRECGR